MDSIPTSAARAVTQNAAGIAAGRRSGQVEAFSEDETGETAIMNVAAAELRQFIERVERLEEEKAAISEDISNVYSEAKGRGYDVKAMRAIVKLRKKDANERLEEESILETYKAALGME